MADLPLYSVVALLEGLPQKGLLRGAVGTVVELLAPGVYEVEFSDDEGVTYAQAAIPNQHLMELHYGPHHAAA